MPSVVTPVALPVRLPSDSYVSTYTVAMDGRGDTFSEGSQGHVVEVPAGATSSSQVVTLPALPTTTVPVTVVAPPRRGR